MTKRPEALRLAEEMSKYRITDESVLQTATELRRLHGVNQELLAALKGMMDWEIRNIAFYSNPAHKRAEAAIAKATGEQA